ncbi:hypothetical protein [Halomontanus rarus]|uniref:hypothetical protein n=1 Tax=Halomontanus rarus TaxID=3034020 RepID=UPI001A98FD7E
MVSRENRVILGSFLLVPVVFAGVAVAELWLGIPFGAYSLLAFLTFAGVAVALPQLYLAKTDTEVDPHSRMRAAVLATVIFAAVFADTSDPLQRRLIIGTAGAAFLGLVGYEFYTGFRDSGTDTPLAREYE